MRWHSFMREQKFWNAQLEQLFSTWIYFNLRTFSVINVSRHKSQKKSRGSRITLKNLRKPIKSKRCLSKKGKSLFTYAFSNLHSSAGAAVLIFIYWNIFSPSHVTRFSGKITWSFLYVEKGTSKTMSVNALHKHKEQQAICHHSCACFMNFFVIRCDSKQCCQAFHAVNGHDQANAWPQDAIHHGGCTPNHAHCCRSGIILGLSRVLLNQSADKMPSLSFGLCRMQQLMSLVF